MVKFPIFFTKKENNDQTLISNVKSIAKIDLNCGNPLA